MGKKDFEKIIEEISRILKNNHKDFRGIYFYGSRVREDAGIRSDYDIAIVFDRDINWKFENEILDTLYNFIIDNDIIIDCKIYSAKEISNPMTPLRQNIKNEGILYGV